jgi:hypothetical protein
MMLRRLACHIPATLHPTLAVVSAASQQRSGRHAWGVFPRRHVPRDPCGIHEYDTSAACATPPSAMHRGPLGRARVGTEGRPTFLSLEDR